MPSSLTRGGCLKTRDRRLGVCALVIFVCWLMISAPSSAWSWESNPTHNTQWYVGGDELDAEAVLAYWNLDPQQNNGISIIDDTITQYDERKNPDTDPPSYKHVEIDQSGDRWVWHCYYDLYVWWNENMPEDVEWICLWAYVTMHYWDESQWEQVDWLIECNYIMKEDPRVPDDDPENAIRENGEFHLWHANHAYQIGDTYELYISVIADYDEGEGPEELYSDEVYIYYAICGGGGPGS